MTDTNTVTEQPHGAFTGRVKWFSPKKGFGFLANIDGEEKDLFVHHSNLNTSENVYRLLYPGEYVNYDEKTDENGKLLAINVTGIKGGKLMCEENNNKNKART